MGVINLTPDSFSGDGILHLPVSPAQVAESLVREGADVLDVGGESTRPGYVPISTEEELDRLFPALEEILEHAEVPVSIDTRKVEVARQAVAAGASIINDVSGLSDPGMIPLAAETGARLVLMHALSVPSGRDVMRTIIAQLRSLIETSESGGVAPERIIIDPGFGFGKTWRQNLEVVQRLGELRVLGKPILLAASRKGTISRVLGVPVDQRLEGSLALASLAIANGVDILRVHDVAESRQVARMMDAVVRQARRS